MLFSRFSLLCFIICLFGSSVESLSQEGQYDARSGVLLPPELQNFEWVNELFEKERLLELELRADFEQLIEQKDDPDYQPGTIIFHNEDQRYTRMRIRLKARGNSRREACNFPPIKLDFTNPETKLEPLKVLDELKLVTHCREGDAFEQYLFREYLTYRLYNLLSPLSFRVRLVRITYADPDGANGRTHYGFLIEEEDLLARRNGGKEVDVEKVKPGEVDQEQLSLVSVFQFMIANLDWSVTGLHNLKLVQREGALYPVPYDFDFAGIVGALYGSGEPAPDMPQAPVNRIYQGYCLPRSSFESVLDRFRARREEMFDEVGQFNLLTQNARTEMAGLIRSFFRIIDSPGQVETYFIRNCRE